jgi:hypothetical protein
MPEADFLLELVMIGDAPAQLFQARNASRITSLPLKHSGRAQAPLDCSAPRSIVFL